MTKKEEKKKKYVRGILVIVILLIGTFLSWGILRAGDTDGDDFAYPEEAWTLQDIIDLIGVIRDFFVIAGILLTVIFLILAGISFFTAGDNATKFQNAKRKLIYAFVGASVVIGTYAIISTIKAFLEKRWS